MTGAEQRGSVTALVAVLAVALVACLGLVVDGGRALAQQQALAGEARQAARAGAAELSVAALRSGELRIDPEAAEVAARAYLSAAGLAGTVAADPARVTVRVEQPVPTDLLSIVGVRTLTVHATASATDVAGAGAGS